MTPVKEKEGVPVERRKVDPHTLFGNKGPRAQGSPGGVGGRRSARGGSREGDRKGGGNSGRGPGGSGPGGSETGGPGSNPRVSFHPANGPLGKMIRVRRETHPKERDSVMLGLGSEHEWRSVGTQANSLIVLRRLSFEPLDGSTNKWKNHEPLHEWATRSRLGQKGTDGLLDQTLERRRSFLRRWVASDVRHRHVRRLLLRVEWRMISGHGLQFGVLDNGLALHGTYGWPTLPGSTLKGLASAGARSRGAETEAVVRALGSPRPRSKDEWPPSREEHRRGSVCFLDALPDRSTMKVHDDVITPHQHPYYTSTDTQVHETAQVGQEPSPPGEHYNPVPLPFLSISGDLRVDLMGDDADDLDAVVEWLSETGEELGGGGRTTAGYGYFGCHRVDDENEDQT